MERFLHWPGHAWLALPARLYLGGVFVLACLHKIAHPEVFALDVATYDILPLWSINAMAITLPWLELVAGVMMIVGFRARAAALAISGMMTMFVVAVLIALSRGIDMSCGCFASQAAAEHDVISWLTVARDIAWLALGLYVVVFDLRPIGIDRITYHSQSRTLL